MAVKSWRTCELTQDCVYGWTVDNVQKFLEWDSVKDYAYIVHDKDKKEDMTDRAPHIHVMLRFKYPVSTSALLAHCVATGLPPECITENRIQKMKSWSGALNYLTHRDEHKPWKFVYDKTDVKSNFDWELDAESAHQKKILRATDARAKEIVEAIDSGEIKEYNLHDKLTAWEEVQYSSQIKKAFSRCRDIKKMKGERKMNVMFIYGKSGVGKDTFAVEWCREREYDYFRTSNNDNYPFDDYKGQPVIIWSDARDNIYKPNQLFALLDNHWSSPQKARYSDINIDCEWLIITSIKPLRLWYEEALKQAEEDRKQLYRRISTLVNMDMDYVRIYLYNQEINDYSYTPDVILPNVYNHREHYLIEQARKQEFLQNAFGGMLSKNLKKTPSEEELTKEAIEEIKSCLPPSQKYEETRAPENMSPYDDDFNPDDFETILE